MSISRAVVRLQRRRLRNRRRGLLRQRRRVLPTGPRHRGLHPAVRGGWGGVVKLCRWEFLGMVSGEERSGKSWFYAILQGFEKSLRWFYGIVMGIKMGFDENFMGFMRISWDFRGERNGNSALPSSKHGPIGGRTSYRFGVTSLGSANIRRDERHNKLLERAPNPRPQYRHSKAAPDADGMCLHHIGGSYPAGAVVAAVATTPFCGARARPGALPPGVPSDPWKRWEPYDKPNGEVHRAMVCFLAARQRAIQAIQGSTLALSSSKWRVARTIQSHGIILVSLAVDIEVTQDFFVTKSWILQEIGAITDDNKFFS